MRRHVTLYTAAVVSVLAVAGCGGGHKFAAPRSGCAPAVQERLDSRSLIHLFPGAATPNYLTDPPTSGPHRLGPPYAGVNTSPIPLPSQVAMLESGYVILQSQALAPGPLATLDTLAATLVAVAPPVNSLPAAVVATAWTWKLECGSVDPPAVTAIRAFVAAHRGVGFVGNFPVTTVAG